MVLLPILNESRCSWRKPQQRHSHSVVSLHSPQWVEPHTSIFFITTTSPLISHTSTQTEATHDHSDQREAHLAVVGSQRSKSAPRGSFRPHPISSSSSSASSSFPLLSNLLLLPRRSLLLFGFVQSCRQRFPDMTNASSHPVLLLAPHPPFPPSVFNYRRNHICFARLSRPLLLIPPFFPSFHLSPMYFITSPGSESHR